LFDCECRIDLFTRQDIITKSFFKSNDTILIF
jgi:hypothetical protein